MKKILILLFVAGIFAALFLLNKSGNSIVYNSIQFSNKNNAPQKEEIYTFVPYWTFSDSLDVSEFNTLIYFGISINELGVDINEEGYSKLASFSELSGDKKKYLALRIIGKHADSNFLDDTNIQKRIGAEAGAIAKQYNFDGVVVDFETSAFGFASTEEKILQMYKNLHEGIKKENLEFLVTVFGDSYYRARPYDIKEIGAISDKVIIMAYDFHKARLNPGPNFPLSGKDKYGYDLKTLLKDFKNDLDFEKIVVTLGYFGYDWKMENGISVEMAEPLSLNQINSRFVDSCNFENCKLEKNDDMESVVSYQDDGGFDHEVWFETIESAEKKIEYLNSMGINQVAFWAHSYY